MSDQNNLNAVSNSVKTIRSIINNYAQNERALVDQLHFAAPQGPTIGGFRETIWQGMFEQIIPKKFVIEQSVFIIDSKGNVSNEVDLAIIDETYTPYIFRYGKLKFLPIEAAAVVVECKSTSLNQEKLIRWAKSITKLQTSNRSYTRTLREIVSGKDNPAPTQTATRPIRILCCLKENIDNSPLEAGDNMFDVIIKAPSKESGLTIEMNNSWSLNDWYLSLNHAGTKDTEKKTEETISNISLSMYEVRDQQAQNISLLSLNLQLNQLLMLINNPMLFPHIAYANMFNQFGGIKDE